MIFLIFLRRPRNDDPQSDGHVVSDAQHSDPAPNDLQTGDEQQGDGQQNEEFRQNGPRNYRPNRRRYYRRRGQFRRGQPRDGEDRSSPLDGERNGVYQEHEPREQDHEREEQKVSVQQCYLTISDREQYNLGMLIF